MNTIEIRKKKRTLFLGVHHETVYHCTLKIGTFVFLFPSKDSPTHFKSLYNLLHTIHTYKISLYLRGHVAHAKHI